MSKTLPFYGYFSLPFYLLVFSLSPFSSHAAITPQAPSGQSFGFYSNGKLIAPSAMPPSGRGWLQIFRARNHYFGTDETIDALVNLSSQFLDEFPTSERIQIADISGEKGGLIPGHASHQNGLDVDVIFMRVNKHEYPEDADPDVGMNEYFVKNGQPTENFDIHRNYILLKRFYETGIINRIFIDRVLKSAICQHSQSLGHYSNDTEFLRKLRHVENHQHHFHVRFECPSSDSKCIKQTTPIPGGSGCPAASSTAQPTE